jgi:hypothetical protein
VWRIKAGGGNKRLCRHDSGNGGFIMHNEEFNMICISKNKIFRAVLNDNNLAAADKHTHRTAVTLLQYKPNYYHIGFDHVRKT